MRSCNVCMCIIFCATCTCFFIMCALCTIKYPFVCIMYMYNGISNLCVSCTYYIFILCAAYALYPFCVQHVLCVQQVHVHVYPFCFHDVHFVCNKCNIYMPFYIQFGTKLNINLLIKINPFFLMLKMPKDF